MEANTYDLQLEIKPYLGADEAILWCDKPKKLFVFTMSEVFTTLFGIVWLAFSMFWVISAYFATSGTDDAVARIFTLFGLPFVLIGLYLVIFRHIFSVISRRKTIYALTSKRAVIVHTGRREYMQEFKYKDISNIRIKSDENDLGSIIFLSSPIHYHRGTGKYANSTSGFFGICDVKKVYKILSQYMENEKWNVYT